MHRQDLGTASLDQPLIRLNELAGRWLARRDRGRLAATPCCVERPRSEIDTLKVFDAVDCDGEWNDLDAVLLGERARQLTVGVDNDPDHAAVVVTGE